jgi:hypothetical protein
MFSGNIPFSDIVNDFQCIIAVKQGRRPSPPTNKLSRRRGLSDEVWEVMEECWSHDPSGRPPASQIVDTLRSMLPPDIDQRPKDDFSWSFPSRLLYDEGNHPFAPLLGTVGVSTP